MKEKSPLLDKQVIIYLSILIIIAVLILISARHILFKPWTARHWAEPAVLGETVYLFGGINDRNATDPKDFLEKDILLLNLDESTLKRAGELPSRRYSVSAAELNGSIYVAGGYDLKSYLDEILVYDPAAQEIKLMGTMPEPRAFGALVEQQGRLFYLGGWNGKEIASTVFEIDPATGSVTEFASPVPPLQLFSSVSTGEKVYVIGGEGSDRKNSNVVYEIDLLKGKVLRKGELPAGVNRAAAAFMNGSIYVIASPMDAEVKEIYRIHCDEEELTVSIPGQFRDRGYDLSLAGYNNHLYLMGGGEERFGRQIRIRKIELATLRTESVLLKSFVWW